MRAKIFIPAASRTSTSRVTVGEKAMALVYSTGSLLVATIAGEIIAPPLTRSAPLIFLRPRPFAARSSTRDRPRRRRRRFPYAMQSKHSSVRLARGSTLPCAPASSAMYIVSTPNAAAPCATPLRAATICGALTRRMPALDVQPSLGTYERALVTLSTRSVTRAFRCMRRRFRLQHSRPIVAGDVRRGGCRRLELPTPGGERRPHGPGQRDQREENPSLQPEDVVDVASIG